MSSYTWQITTSGNDGQWQEGNSVFSATGSTSFMGGYYDGTAGRFNSFFRFTNITIPKNARIISAKIIATCKETRSDATVNAVISAVDADNPAAPTTSSGCENATRTTASVDWDNIAAWTIDTEYDSPDITTVIQELVNRSGWASGNAMVLYIEDNGSTAVANTVRRAYSYDDTPAKALQLYVEWAVSVTVEDSLTITDEASLDEVVDRIYKTGSDTLTITETVKIDKHLVLADTITARDSVVPTRGTFTEVLSHPHTTKLYLAVKTPRIVWTGRVLNERGYNQDGDIESDFTININTALSYGSVSGFDVANFLPDLTAWIGTTAGGKDHGVCRIRSFDGNNLKVSADMTCVWSPGDYVYITDLHELWPMPHIATESGGSVLVKKDIDLNAGSQKDEYPVPVMGPSACAFINPSTGKATVRFNGTKSYLVQPNSDEHHWDSANGISAYSWWFEGADVTTSSVAEPTAQYSTAGQYVVSLELTGENGRTFKGFRNVFIYDAAHPPITDFSIRSLSGDLSSHGWEAIIDVFEGAFDADTLPDKAEVVLFAQEYFNGSTKTLHVGHGADTYRDNVKMVGYASDTSIKYESGKIRGASMSLMGLQEMLKGKTNFPVYVTQIETHAPSWSYFSDGLTVRIALYHLVRWHWTLLRFADFLIPDDHNNYFPGKSWAEGSLASQLDAFCPDIQAEWAVDKTGALTIFSKPNYLPVSGDGAGWRTRLYQDVDLTDADFVSLEAESRIKHQVARVRVEGVYATESNYWVSVDSAPGNSKNHGGGTKLVSKQILGTGGFVGSQGEELARMVYAEESRRWEHVVLELAGNYSFFDVVPGGNYFRLTATPSNLRGVSWTDKPFWVTDVSLSFDHESGDLQTTVTAIPETRPDPSLAIYSQYDEIGESLTAMPQGGGFSAAQLLQEIDAPDGVLVPALMGDGGEQTEGAESGTSIVRLFGDLNQTVVAENRLLADIPDRPILIEVSNDPETNKPSFRVVGARVNNDSAASAVTNRAFTTRYANFSRSGLVTAMTGDTPILQIGSYMPKTKIVGFTVRARIGGSGAVVQLLLNGAMVSEVSLPAGAGSTTETVPVDRSLVADDYLSIQVISATGVYDLLATAECLVYGI